MTIDGLTPEGLEDLKRETYMRLLEVFEPFAKKTLTSRLEREIVECSFDDEEMEAVCKATLLIMLERRGSIDEAERYMRETRRRLLAVEAMPPDARVPAFNIEGEVDEMLDALVANWMHVLYCQVEGEEGAETLDVAILGNDMLPKDLPESCRPCLWKNLVWTVMSETAARSILAFVHASLGGAKLPAPAVELFRLWGVTVIDSSAPAEAAEKEGGTP